MKCPQCNVPLTMSQREGIEIDYCPQCRGVWLDRGELDKIIERSAQYAGRRDDDDDDDDDRYKRGYPPSQQQHAPQGYPQQQPPPPYYYKKKKSFWSELFD